VGQIQTGKDQLFWPAHAVLPHVPASQCPELLLRWYFRNVAAARAAACPSQAAGRDGKYIGVRHAGGKSWECCCGGDGGEVGRRGMGSVGKQPASVTARRAAAATVITNIDVFSTASFQTHSLIFLFFFLHFL